MFDEGSIVQVGKSEACQRYREWTGEEWSKWEHFASQKDSTPKLTNRIGRIESVFIFNQQWYTPWFEAFVSSVSSLLLVTVVHAFRHLAVQV